MMNRRFDNVKGEETVFVWRTMNGLLKTHADIPIRTAKGKEMVYLKVKPIDMASAETTMAIIIGSNTTVADVINILIDENKIPKGRFMLRLGGRILSPNERIKDASAQTDNETEIIVWNPQCPIFPNWSRRKDDSCKRLLCGELQRYFCGAAGAPKHPSRPKRRRRYRLRRVRWKR